MKDLLNLFFLLTSLNLVAQIPSDDITRPIVEEGKRLYRLEMASWFGTDVFIANYTNKENIGGYFSYAKEAQTTCLFFSREENPKVIGTITFDSTYNVETADTSFTERIFTSVEKDIYTIRSKALKEIQSDTLFKLYSNTNLNLIPIESEGLKKVYVLTGPQEHGVVVFGNDYLLTFDDGNNLIEKKQLHNNIIPINMEIEDIEEGGKVVSSSHTHLPETGDFITATDICTLMLYGKYTDWKQHYVISKKYMNIWNITENTLVVIGNKTLKNIEKDQKKREKKKGKKKR